ncbi:SO_0444 family Cu/Zn efflux transporter [Marinomonas epiphytica]
MNLIDNFLVLFLESAPWLLLGLMIAGLLNVFIPMNWMNKQLGGHGLKATIKAAFIGAPLPLCSCGVIPAAVGLRRSGASRSATTSFMVSTPETGLDSISVSYVLLGPFMAVVRPIAAILSAILAGLLVGQEDKKEQKLQNSSAKPTSSCCTSKTEIPEQVKETTQTSCCSSNKEPTAEAIKETSVASACCSSDKPAKPKSKFLGKLAKAFRYASTNLLDDTVVWLMIGLGFAAVVQTYVSSDFLASWGNGLLAMLVIVIISIPMYICATASTPIAAGLLMAGVSPGAALVFMLAGPATNIATLGVVAKELGRRALLGYLTGVLGGALSFGFLIDYLVTEFGFHVAPQIGPEHELLPLWATVVSGALLGSLVLLSLYRKGKKRFL